MADLIFDDWKSSLDKLKSSIEKDLEEIRQQKEEIQRLKIDIFDKLNEGRYYRDEQRIVLSAPEIIIGDVDSSGDLWGGGNGSKVIIRSNDIRIEATGSSPTGGSIENRASSIRNIAVDPGLDGLEDALFDRSEIINQARSITLQSNDDEGCFAQDAVSLAKGIEISSDSSINIAALVKKESKTDSIKDYKKTLNDAKKELSSLISSGKSSVEKLLDDMKKLNEDEGENTWGEDLDGFRGNYSDMVETRDSIEDMQKALYMEMNNYIHNLAASAEISRKLKMLDKMSDTASKMSDYKTKSTGAVINILSESTSIASVDGDGNIRDNDDAGVSISAPNFSVSSRKGDGSLVEKGSINLEAMTFNLSTNDTKDGKTMPAAGNVKIQSKNVTIESVDYKMENDKVEEDKLADKGLFSVRAETISVEATAKDGKATGSISLNAKDTMIKAMDVDEKERKDKSLAAGSNLLLLAEKMFVGSKKKDIKSKSVQISSEKVGIMAKDTAEMQQGEGKAVFTLTGGNATMGGSKNELKGDTTIGGKADIKGDTTMPKATIDNLEAKTSFKSSNISDGIAVPKPGTPEKPSAKITEEEMADKG